MQLGYNADHELAKSVSIVQQGFTITIISTDYYYDAFGRRIFKHSERKQQNRLHPDGNLLAVPRQPQKTQQTRIRYLWDGNRQLQEQTDTHVFTTVYEQDSFEPVARLVWLKDELSESANDDSYTDDKPTNGVQVFHYHNDHLGTPNELTNHNGEVVWLADYEAWGNTAKVVWREEKLKSLQVSADELQPIRFQGQSFDTETGLHYNRFRYFDPDLGMFTTRDPIGLMGGNNVFQYAPNPVGWVDPFGLTECTDVKPTGGGWKNAPNWDKWRSKGGKVTPNVDGSVIYTRADGVSVTYSKDGYPEFSPFAKETVSVDNLRGDHYHDFIAANKKIGVDGKTPEPGYTWHHHEDGKTMQLVPTIVSSKQKCYG